MGIHGLMNIINDEAPAAVKEAVSASSKNSPGSCLVVVPSSSFPERRPVPDLPTHK
jgi:hypothetical protein